MWSRSTVKSTVWFRPREVIGLWIDRGACFQETKETRKRVLFLRYFLLFSVVENVATLLVSYLRTIMNHSYLYLQHRRFSPFSIEALVWQPSPFIPLICLVKQKGKSMVLLRTIDTYRLVVHLSYHISLPYHICFYSQIFTSHNF